MAKNQIPRDAAKLKTQLPKPDFEKILAESVTFSFKYLDLHSNEKFSVSRWRENEGWSDKDSLAYLETLLARLKDVCGMRISEFQNSSSKGIRSHSIKWSKTSEPDGFSLLNEELREKEGWQFQLTANKYGRVHGFMLDKHFCVVWLDPFHKLYPS